MATTPALITTFTPSSYCFGSSIYGGYGTMTLGDPSNFPACYPSGSSNFSPGLICPSGWHASSTSTVSSTLYLAMCCPAAALADSTGVVWIPSFQGCSYDLSQNLVTHGWVIQPDSTYSIYEGLTMGHLEANRILLQWQDADLSLVGNSPAITTSSAAAAAAATTSHDSETPNRSSPTATTSLTENTAEPGEKGKLSSNQKTVIGVTIPVTFFFSVVVAIWLILRHRRFMQSNMRPAPTPRQSWVHWNSELPVERDMVHEMHSNEVGTSEIVPRSTEA